MNETDLSQLPENVREAVRAFYGFAGSQMLGNFATVRADLLRVYAENAQVKAERDAALQELGVVEHKVITCGVAAHHPDAALAHTGAYAGQWDSPQAQDVRALRAERDALRKRIEQSAVVRVRGKVGEVATITLSHDLVGKRVRLVVEDGE